MTMDQMARELLSLPTESRASLAALLLESLDEVTDPISEVEEAWRVEVRRRVAEIDAGTAECRDGEEALREIEARLK